jgi:2-oxoisovalerate dehydrogenase E1 component
MFGDFLTLCFDQLVNHTAKFQAMYNQRVTNPIVVRAPMGGGRGYGPTHSQNLEKYVVGIPGLTVVVLHGRTCVSGLYAALRSAGGPVLVIENKLLYRERGDAPVPPGYTLMETNGPFPTAIVRPAGRPDLTVVAYGRMSVLAERAAAWLAAEEEVTVELLFPLGVSPFDPDPILESVARTGKLLVVEEGTAGFDLASEAITAVSLGWRGSTPLRARRLGARPMPIPSAMPLEQVVLPSERGIVDACLELFSE